MGTTVIRREEKRRWRMGNGTIRDCLYFGRRTSALSCIYRKGKRSQAERSGKEAYVPATRHLPHLPKRERPHPRIQDGCSRRRQESEGPFLSQSMIGTVTNGLPAVQHYTSVLSINKATKEARANNYPKMLCVKERFDT